MSKEPTHVVIASSDPVAENAARYAIEVTDTTPAHPILGKLLIVLIISFIIIGTFGAVLGTLNSVTLSRQNQILSEQNDELKAQQACTTQLLNILTVEQKARADIAADDRNAIKTLVSSISHAKSEQDIEKAFTLFNKESRMNDIRRAQYPVPVSNSKLCTSVTVQTPSTKPISPGAPSKSSSHAAPGKGPGKSTSTPGAPKPSGSAHSTPHTNKSSSHGAIAPRSRTAAPSSHTVAAGPPARSTPSAGSTPTSGLVEGVVGDVCNTLHVRLVC